MKKEYPDRNKVRRTTVAFSLSKVEREALNKAAAAMGISVSGYIRYKLFYETKED